MSVISSADIKNRQKNVTVYFDSAKISLNEVYMLQRIKAGEKTNLLDSELRELESKASYVVIRAETKQYCKMDEQATVLSDPISRISYYSSFPNLESKQSKDYTDFADQFGRLKNDGFLLKAKFKEVLRLNRDIAGFQREGFDVVTPNAFLSGLERTSEQLKAKRIFAQAVFEVAQETCSTDFLGFFVHEDKNIFQDESAHYQDIKTPVLIGLGADASSPMRACHALKNGYAVAESVMAHPLHPVGNGAIGPRAALAKEENDDRVMLGDIEWMFSPVLNIKLLAQDQYKPISGVVSVVRSTLTTSYKGLTPAPANSTQLRPKQKLKADMIKMGIPILDILIAPDLHVKNKQVLKLVFAKATEARTFAATVESLTTKVPAVTIVNETIVILGQDRAKVYFESCGMTMDGTDLFNALAQDQRRFPGADFTLS